MIYASIILKDGGYPIKFKPLDHDNIYNAMMKITDGDHEISSDAASWCELATIGEKYEFREGEIEIVLSTTKQKGNKL